MDINVLTFRELEAIILDETLPFDQRHAAVNARLLTKGDVGDVYVPPGALPAAPVKQTPLQGRYAACPGAMLGSWVVIEIAREGCPSQVAGDGYASRPKRKKACGSIERYAIVD
jgi:hypothetical protein